MEPGELIQQKLYADANTITPTQALSICGPRKEK